MEKEIHLTKKGTKEVVILGAKDNEGNIYTMSGYEHRSCKFDYGNWVNVGIVEVFPYNTFTLSPLSKPSEFKLTYFKVEMEMSDNEFDNLSPSWIGYHQFKNRRVKCLQEVSSPWLYADSVYKEHKKKEVENLKIEEKKHLLSNLRYEMITWQSMLGFESDEEFEVYKSMYSEVKQLNLRYEFHLTKMNFSYLERIVQELDIEISLNCVLSSDVSKDKEGFPQFVNTFSDDDLVSLMKKCRGFSILDIEDNRRTKGFYEKLLNFREIESLIESMSEAIREEFGYDVLFEMAYKNLDTLIASHGYEPYELENDMECEYDYDDDDDDDDERDYPEELYEPETEMIDERDDELAKISGMLPHLTEKSLPPLKTLVYEKIEPYLSEELKGNMKNNEKSIA